METILIAVAILAILNSAGIAMLLLRDKTKATPGQGGSAVVDTSGLIDGRILDIAKAGFIPKNILVPHAVIGELQHLADLADPQKRERARFGLDVVKQLQAMPSLNIHVIGDEAPGLLVDDQLVKIADMNNAALYTTDYNLNKVAAIKGVTVLNVNELAQSLRSSALPGEKGQVKIIQKGQDSSQGVGYMPDGTMVVVEKAGGRVGQSVEVTFSRVLQTQAGKMLFAKLDVSELAASALKPQQQAKKQQKPPQVAKPAAIEEHKDEQPQVKQQQPQRSRHQQRRRRTPEDSLLEAVKRLEE